MEARSEQRKINDPFINAIISHIPLDVQKTLTLVQRDALIDALTKARSEGGHLIDVRVTLHLFFERLYFVLLIGKDRRQATRKILIERRQKASFMAGAVFILVLFLNVFLTVSVLGFFILYFAKSFLGIDIFPDQHLWDFLNMLDE
jgi:hypothetical protein